MGTRALDCGRNEPRPAAATTRSSSSNGIPGNLVASAPHGATGSGGGGGAPCSCVGAAVPHEPCRPVGLAAAAAADAAAARSHLSCSRTATATRAVCTLAHTRPSTSAPSSPLSLSSPATLSAIACHCWSSASILASHDARCRNATTVLLVAAAFAGKYCRCVRGMTLASPTRLRSHSRQPSVAAPVTPALIAFANACIFWPFWHDAGADWMATAVNGHAAVPYAGDAAHDAPTPATAGATILPNAALARAHSSPPGLVATCTCGLVWKTAAGSRASAAYVRATPSLSAALTGVL